MGNDMSTRRGGMGLHPGARVLDELMADDPWSEGWNRRNQSRYGAMGCRGTFPLDREYRFAGYDRNASRYGRRGAAPGTEAYRREMYDRGKEAMEGFKAMYGEKPEDLRAGMEGMFMDMPLDLQAKVRAMYGGMPGMGTPKQRPDGTNPRVQELPDDYPKQGERRVPKADQNPYGGRAQGSRRASWPPREEYDDFPPPPPRPSRRPPPREEFDDYPPPPPRTSRRPPPEPEDMYGREERRGSGRPPPEPEYLYERREPRGSRRSPPEPEDVYGRGDARGYGGRAREPPPSPGLPDMYGRRGGDPPNPRDSQGYGARRQRYGMPEQRGMGGEPRDGYGGTGRRHRRYEGSSGFDEEDGFGGQRGFGGQGSLGGHPFGGFGDGFDAGPRGGGYLPNSWW